MSLPVTAHALCSCLTVKCLRRRTVCLSVFYMRHLTTCFFFSIFFLYMHKSEAEMLNYPHWFTSTLICTYRKSKQRTKHFKQNLNAVYECNF